MMSVTWTGEGGVFTRIGKLFKAFLIFEAWQNAGTGTIPDLEDEVLDSFGEDRDLTIGLYEKMEDLRSDPNDWKSRLVPYAEGVIRGLADELDAPSDGLATVWPLFIERMGDDVQTVERNEVSVSSPAAGAENVGNGELAVSTEGVDGEDVEILIPEALRFSCIADRGTGAGEDAESFRASGETPAPSRTSHAKRGTGTGGTTTVANASYDNRISNGDFEDFAVTNTPDSWDADAGVIGTHILKSTDCYRGAAALHIFGFGVLTTVGISQTFAAGRIAARRKYAIGVWIKTESVSQGTINIRLAGTGFTPDADHRIEIGSAWPTSWTFYSCFVNTPALVPEDLEIVVEVTGTLNDEAIVTIDGLALVPVAEHHGLSWAIFAGSTPFAVDDYFTATVSNTEAGLFQTMFGRLWDVQLPSAASASETVPDSLCE